MRRPAALALAALLLASLAAPALRAQQQRPADARGETPVNALQVRRACLNEDGDERLRQVCALRLPASADSLRHTTTWKEWLGLFKDTAYHVADSIRVYSDALDTDEVSVWDVFGLLTREQQASVVERFGEKGALVDAARRLPSDTREALAGLVFRPVPGDTFPPLPEAVTKAFQKVLNDLVRSPRPDTAWTLVFDSAMALPDLPDSLRVALLARIPEARDSALRQVLGPHPVSQLVKRLPNSGVGQQALRALRGETPASSSTQPLPGSRVTQSSLLWGTTDFVVERVQQQLQAFALQGFAGQLCGGVGTEVLPASCEVIRSDDFGISQPGLGLLRGAVRRDLEALPYGVLSWAYTRYADSLVALGRGDAVQTALRLTAFTLRTARGSDPLLALATVADSFGMAAANSTGRRVDTLEASVAQLAARVRALEGTAGAGLQEARARLDSVRTVLRSALGRLETLTVSKDRFPGTSIILGLAALHSTRLDPLRLQTLDWGEADARELLRYQVIAMAANYQPRVRAAADQLAFEPWNVVPVALAVQERFDTLRALKRSLDEQRRANPDTAAVVRAARAELARSAFSFVDAVLFETSQLWGPQLVEQARQVALGVQEVVFPVMEGDLPAGLLALNRQVGVYLDSVSPAGVRTDFTRGVTFVNELATASSADQVNAALVRLADSGEGFLAKRKGDQPRVTLNAYGGLHGGTESVNNEASLYAGLYLPVGVQLTFRGQRRALGRSLGTAGVFAQVLDLGALASWRLENDDDVEEAPEVGVGQVFSPGLFAVLNVKDAPLSIGLGVSWAPQLREITRESTTPGTQQDGASRASAWRWGLFAAFDIPLFP